MASDLERANAVKQLGNKFYAKGKYAAAADKYTEAICMCPSVAIFYSNRSLCFKQRRMWSETLRDAVKAIELDPLLYKAHMLRGEAKCNLGDWESGIPSLKRAIEVAERKNVPKRVIDSLQAVLEKSLKERFECQTVQDEMKDDDMLQFLQESVQAYLAQRMAGLAGTDAEVETRMAPIKDAASAHLQRLQSLVAEQRQRRQASEAPEYLCGPISFELYRDPVVAPSGHVYERRCLMEHLSRSATDPLTRAPLTAKQVYPCHPMRHAAKDFLEKNPWAAP